MIEIRVKDEVKTKMMIAESGNSLRSFSKHIGISHPYLCQVLNHHRNVSPITAKRISDGLGKKIDDIFFVRLVDINKQN
jgi:putative transcriptional regulator